MKICMLTSGHDVFDNRIYYKELLSLKKIYNELYLIAPGEKDFITPEGIVVKCFKRRKSWYDRFSPMNRMFKLAMEIGADVYHAHEPDSLQVAIKLKARTGAKVIYDSHEYYPEAFSEHFSACKGMIQDSVYLYEKHLASRADYIITVNNLLVGKFKKYHKNVELIPNYPVFSEVCTEKEYIDKPVFVYAGGLREDRGILKILEAINMVKIDAKYIFIGEFETGEFKEKVNNYIENNLKDREIVFTGKIPHLKVFEYLKSADAGFVLLQPYNWRYVNSEPIKLFEYMMSKTAVIASDFPMMKDVIEKADCGFVVRPDDSKSIAEVIDFVCSNREKVSEMGENGSKSAKELYNWSAAEKRLLNVYDELS